MDKCRNHFNSSDTVLSVSDAERLLATLHELKDLVEQATGSVQTQGKTLVDVLVTIAPPPPLNKKYGTNSPVLDSRSVSVTDDMSDLDFGRRRRSRPKGTHSAENLLDESVIEETDNSDDVITESSDEGRDDSTRLLVTPRKTRPGLKSYKSSPVSLALSPDQVHT